MTARNDIFARIRAALGRDDANRVAADRAIEASFSEHAWGPRPALQQAELFERFRHKSLEQSCTVDEVFSLDEVPAMVGTYLNAHRLSNEAVVWPQLAELDWQTAGLAVETRAPRNADLIGITGCFCAIAETGTLMMVSGPQTPASTSLLPETHIAIVPSSSIVAGMEEGWQLLRTEFGNDLPRAVNFISGPSRTADIEQTLVLGAHGPYRVHLILVRED